MDHPQKKEIAADAARLRRAGADVEMLLRFLRDKGLNQPDSIDVLMRVAHLELGQARDAMFASETWADHRELNMRIHEQLMEALRQLSQEDDGKCKFIIEEAKPPDEE